MPGEAGRDIITVSLTTLQGKAIRRQAFKHQMTPSKWGRNAFLAELEREDPVMFNRVLKGGARP